MNKINILKHIRIFKFLFTKKRELPEIPSTRYSTNEFHQEIDWWQKKSAVEWWSRNGHFNDDLYNNILLDRIDSSKKL
jgi:hypothetical protein